MDNTTRMRVGVLFGGRSAEHEVSILSARNVLAALDPQRFEPVPIGITRDGRWIEQSMQRLLRDRGDPSAAQLAGEGPEISLLPRRREDAHIATARERGLDVIFPVLHGPQGEDGSVQGLLELAGLPYVGAGVLGSAIGMDKDVMKRLLRDAGIAVARFVVLRKNDYHRNPLAVLREAEPLGYPLFVKPANLGSSVGITRVVSPEALPGALETAFAYDLKVILEEAIEGREIECSVLGNDTPVASVPGEIIVTHPDAFYSYDAKYVDDHAAELRVPARLDLVTQHAVQRLTLKTFQVLEGSGIARVDFFLETGGRLLVNEINTLPGFTAISMYPKLWAASGVPPRELTSRLIDLAVQRHAQRRELRSVCSLR